MSEADFTNREILSMHKEQMKVLTRIEEQTIKTNGRVTALEKINEKKDGATSVIKYIGIFLAATLLSYLTWLGVNVNQISSTLSAYEITIE